MKSQSRDIHTFLDRYGRPALRFSADAEDSGEPRGAWVYVYGREAVQRALQRLQMPHVRDFVRWIRDVQRPGLTNASEPISYRIAPK